MINQNNILISACLFGEPVRYNGTDLLIEHPLIEKWQKQDRLIPMCPELAGGMSVPRAAAEIIEGNGDSVLSGNSRVVDNLENDVTKAFILGANKTLKHAQKFNCIAAILTEGSPSCGSQLIYDGTFSNNKKSGKGVTTTLLEQHGIKVFNQYQIELVEKFLDKLLEKTI